MRPAATRASRRVFACSDCGSQAAKWQGRCDACGAWNTLAEAAAVADRRAAPPLAVPGLRRLDEVRGEGATRTPSGIGELDRVLGGGVVSGSLILLGGDPGIGKSTLALQLAARLGLPGAPALYCAGEESVAQVAMRAGRLGCRRASIAVVTETDLDGLVAVIEAHRPPLAVIDSVQTIDAAAAPGLPGSPAQVRDAAGRLLGVAKATDVPIVLVGHVTKEGAIAGPRTLEHMVDVVLYLEGERHGEHRLLRGVKNRFGATGELGLFEMDGTGLREVGAPGRAFLDESSLGVPGCVLAVTCEGSRPLVVEIQALLGTADSAIPRRASSGFDAGRLHLLLAILERRAGVRVGGRDVYINVVGGVRVADPAVDLAVAVAVASSAQDRPVRADTALVGELGLGGEVRRAPRLEQRLGEASALGLARAVVPAAGPIRGRPPLVLDRVATLRSAVAATLHPSAGR